MRRVFALLLLTPLLASCADSATSATPVAPADAVLSEGAVSTEEWPAEDSPTAGGWFTSEDVFAEDEISAQGAPASGELMAFGNPDAGTGFPSGAHDASFHGKDRVIPGTVVIDAGQKVTFRVYPTHRVAIYKPGVRPGDIKVGPGFFVLDPTNRMALQAAPVPSLSFTFHKPGRYLVICAIRPHFVNANMYGWVIVR